MVETTLATSTPTIDKTETLTVNLPPEVSSPSKDKDTPWIDFLYFIPKPQRNPSFYSLDNLIWLQ